MNLPAGWYNFYYHDVSNDPRVPLSVRMSPDRFKSEMAFIVEHFDVIPFDEGVERLRAGSHNKPRASISFDDGFRSVLTNALPVLKAKRIPQIIFLNAAFLNREGASDSVIATRLGQGSQLRDTMHPDRFGDLWTKIGPTIDCDELFLDWNSLDEFPDDLTTFGNHTRSHYWMAGLPSEKQLEEIRSNHEALKHLPGYRSLMALPFGTSSCFDEGTLRANDQVHGDVVIKAVGGINHQQVGGRWIIERMGMADEKMRIDDVLRERVAGKDIGYRLRKLHRKALRIARKSSI
jgi:peptidoglycan/xylan/chitin deacetylase (PgdA/CDA1 family)